MYTENYYHAVADLKTVKTVDQWNTVREKRVPSLSQDELGSIDGSGLIVEVLGKDQN